MAKPKQTKAEQQSNHAAVTLPAGSYDFQKLHSGLDKAVAADADKRGQVVDKALEGARETVEGQVLDRDVARLPGHTRMVAETVLAPGEEREVDGTVTRTGELVVRENVQVYTGDDDGQAGTGAPVIAVAGVSGGPSETVNLEPATEPAPIAPAPVEGQDNQQDRGTTAAA